MATPPTRPVWALLSNAGTVTVDKGATLNLTATGTDTNSGSITVNGGTLSMQAGSFTNSGTLDLEKKGTLTVTGNLTNSRHAYHQQRQPRRRRQHHHGNRHTDQNTGATVTIGANNDTTDTASVGLLANAGTVTVDKGATLKLTATGADSNTGSIALNGGTLTIARAAPSPTPGTLDLETGGKLNVTGGLTNAGTLTTNKANLGGAANTHHDIRQADQRHRRDRDHRRQ